MLSLLSFAKAKLLANNIVEVVVNEGIIVSIEMVEELEQYLERQFSQPFGILINRKNHYEYSFEAMYCMASHRHLSAIAVVNYHELSQDPIHQILQLRDVDELNVAVFSGLSSGITEAKAWLVSELSHVMV